jgi:hypothetical protein
MVCGIAEASVISNFLLSCIERIEGALFKVYSISRSALGGVGRKDGKSNETGTP